MIDWEKLSIHARIALCLVYAEKMIPAVENMIKSREEYKEYLQGKQQMEDILDLGWQYLQEKNNVEWREMYRLCNEDQYGYFDFLSYDEEEDNDNLSSMVIYCFYYAMYHYAKRQNEKYLPQDMEWFEMEESEEEMFSCIDNAINVFIPLNERQKIESKKEKLYKLYPFNQSAPYGEYISKDEFMKHYGAGDQ